MNIKPDTKDAKPVDDLRSRHLKPAEMPGRRCAFLAAR